MSFLKEIGSGLGGVCSGFDDMELISESYADMASTSGVIKMEGCSDYVFPGFVSDKRMAELEALVQEEVARNRLLAEYKEKEAKRRASREEAKRISEFRIERQTIRRAQPEEFPKTPDRPVKISVGDRFTVKWPNHWIDGLPLECEGFEMRKWQNGEEKASVILTVNDRRLRLSPEYVWEKL